MARSVVARRRPPAQILEGLNPEQKRAVLAVDGPVLVLAGAGTGKTRVITRRIAHLLAKKPRGILAVTFTNKAAREMRQRASALVSAGASKGLVVSTFHSFCLRLLREHAAAAGLPSSFSICDDADQLSAVKAALRELRIAEARVHPRAALSRISLFKSRFVAPDQAMDEAVDDYDELVARAYRAYEEALRRARTVDFDDLLLRAGTLLARDAKVLKALQRRFHYLMVDEYQDTNVPQYEILRRLAGTRQNLFVVGDDDQSIYGWRGADVKKILRFEKDFPKTRVVRLETNYRSTEEILGAANRVIRNNRSRHDKSLRASVGAGEPVRVLELADEEHEAQVIVDEIAREVRHGRATFGDIAILFRTQVQPRPFETALRAARVPYDLVGGPSFFDRKEVRDLLAFLRLAAHPEDEQAFLRIVNVPPRGVGKTTVGKAVAFATEKGISAVGAFDDAPGIPEGALAAVRDLKQTLSDVSARAGTGDLAGAVRTMIAGVNYVAEVERCYEDAAARQARWAAVEEVVNLAENHMRRKGRSSLRDFLDEVTLAADETLEKPADDAPREAVTLMTLHAAKGLEFPRVYLVGVEEGLLPHKRSMEENTVEEERRLMYVGITRAKRHLSVTRAATRAKYGRREPCVPSRFLKEMRGEPTGA